MYISNLKKKYPLIPAVIEINIYLLEPTNSKFWNTNWNIVIIKKTAQIDVSLYKHFEDCIF